MHLSCIWKICVSLLVCFSSIAQSDSSANTAYNTYRDNPILYGDLGFNSAPFSIKYDFGDGIQRVKFRHNFKTMLGIGYAHRWFSLRLGLAVVGNVRPQSRYGTTNYFDFSGTFELKGVYNEIGLRLYRGYVIKDAFIWDSTFNALHPNDTDQSISAGNFYMKTWYFFNQDFKLKPFDGIRGNYNINVLSPFINGRLDFFSVGNDKGRIIPDILEDSLADKTASRALSGFEIGAIPGLAYVGKIGNWQYGLIAGIGPTMQIKAYQANGITRSFTSLMPKYELDAQISYQRPEYFFIFKVSSDYKMINFTDLKFRQNYYMMRLTIGRRFKERPKKPKQK